MKRNTAAMSFRLKTLTLIAVLNAVVGGTVIEAADAPGPDVSELEARLEVAAGDERIEALLALAKAYEYREPDRVQEYAGRALAEARAAERPRLVARALLGQGTGRFQGGDLDGAEASYGAGLEAARALGMTGEAGGCLNGLAAVAMKRGDQDRALELFGQAMAALEDSDRERLAGVHNNRALIYYAKGQLDLALDDMTAALELYQALDNEQGQGIVLNSIGALYSRLGEPEKAGEHFQQALEIAERNGHTHLMLSALVNLGELLVGRKQWSEALTRYQRALEIARSIDSPDYVAVCLNNIGDVLRQSGDLDGALARYLESLEIFEQMNARPRVVASWLNLGHTYLAMDHRQEAKSYLTRALDGADETGELNLRRDAAAALAELAERTGDYRRALEMQRLIAELERTIFSRENIAKAASLEAQFEADRREQHIQLLTKEAEIQELRAKRQRLWLAVIASVVLALAVVVAVLASRYRLKVRSAAELRQANERITELARHDALTGLLNRRSGQERLDVEAARSRRTGRPFCLLMLDVDDFKAVNDSHGHECGDALLVHIAKLLTGRLRSQDMVARWGGEELLILLPETYADGAAGVAEELRQAIATTPVTCGQRTLDCTVTIGAAERSPAETVGDTLRRADEAMYAGKRAGKNRVVVADDALVPDAG